MDVYRACGVVHGSEEGPLEPVPLTEDSALRTNGQTYPPEAIKMLQKIFGWLDDEYDKIPVERTVMGDSRITRHCFAAADDLWAGRPTEAGSWSAEAH